MNKKILELKVTCTKAREAALNYAIASGDYTGLKEVTNVIETAEEKLDAAAAAMDGIQPAIEAMISTAAECGGGTDEDLAARELLKKTAGE